MVTQIITSIIVAALTAMVGGFMRYISKSIKDVHATFHIIKEAQKATMRDILVQRHDYFMSRGHIGKYSLASIEEMFRNYEDLGGNGFVRELMEDIRGLPIQ